MTSTLERRDIVIGLDPVRNRHLAPARAADEAHRRLRAPRPVVAVPPSHDVPHGEDTARRRARAVAGEDALRVASAWARGRQPDVRSPGDPRTRASARPYGTCSR